MIATEAREIADSSGLDAVSMRTLAERLQCTPRALYRHVADKEALLALVADNAFADIPETQLDVDWQEAWFDYFTRVRQLLLDSPAVAMIIAQQPVAGPSFRRHMDRLVSAMTSAGFDTALALEAVVALSYFALGASLPGTGQTLQDVYRLQHERDDVADLSDGGDAARGFIRDAADEQFRVALRHLLHGYAVNA